MGDLTGQTLGQYEIIRLIGRGGMASVYLARQQSIGRQVAVKVLPPHLMSDDTFFKRFQREVKTVAHMQHPRIIPVHDYGEHEGTPYIVMAYIEGGSLTEYLHERGALPLAETVRLVAQIGEGLDYAHGQGVIHRDFKPSNVLLDKQRNAYLSDFGIAKISQDTAQLTGSGIVGTPTYMAPESFKQERPTPAVDIYAVGVTLYQMLSGAAPYEGSTPVQLMYSHINDPVPSIEAARQDVPPALQAVLERAMAKTPEARYPTCAILAEDLRRAASGETIPATLAAGISAAGSTAAPVPTTPAPIPSPVVPPARGNWLARWWRVLIAAGAVGLALCYVPGGFKQELRACFVPAMLGALVLTVVHLIGKKWLWVGLWLILPLCGVASLALASGPEGSPEAAAIVALLMRIFILAASITGLVLEIRVARGQTAPPAQAQSAG